MLAFLCPSLTPPTCENPTMSALCHPLARFTDPVFDLNRAEVTRNVADVLLGGERLED